MIYYESGAMAREQKLERLKEIEKEFIKQKENLNSGIFCIREANKIGEELIGCGKLINVQGINGICGKGVWLCPTCKEAKERLARINNG